MLITAHALTGLVQRCVLLQCCRVDVCARETLLSRVLPMIEDSVLSHVVCSVNDACAGVGPSWDTEVRKDSGQKLVIKFCVFDIAGFYETIRRNSQ